MSPTLRSISDIEVVLASTAIWRSEILTRLRLPHRCVPHRYPEPTVFSGPLDTFVQETALKKAESIQSDYPRSMIISADQLISLEAAVFYKPGSPSKAVEQLLRLNGRWHRLICAVAVIYGKVKRVRFEEARLKMRQLTGEEIDAYVAYDQPWNCAGSYRIESLGASLFEAVLVRDLTSIIGLPSNLLIDIIRELGFTNLYH